MTWTEEQESVAGEPVGRKWEKRSKTSVDVDLYSAGAAVECGRRPGYPAVAVNLDVHVEGHIEHTVIAAKQQWRRI